MSEQHQVTVESLVDFPKDVGKAFLGRDWRAMALDSSHLSALTHFGHHLPSHQFPTTKSRKPFPIFYVGISNQTSLAGLRTPRGRLRRDSEGFCGHDGRSLSGQSDCEDVNRFLIHISISYISSELQFSTIF